MAWIKKVYLYLVSLISLIIIIWGATMLVNMGLKAVLDVEDYVSYPSQYCSAPKPMGDMSIAPDQSCDPDFQAKMEEADKKNRANNKKRETAQALALLIVGTPVFLYHWKLARKEA
jgi:hypothetical protein